MTNVLAIDVGATKCSVAHVSDQGQVTGRRDTPTTGHATGDALFDAILALVHAVGTGGVDAIGVGACSGVPSGEVHALNIPVWREGFPLGARLAEHTGLPTFVDNDAKAIALAEGRFGAAHGVDNYIGMVVSTGIGGGIVLNGRLLDGAAGNAGHIGHITVEPNGRECACGARGCLEAEASGPAIAAITGRPPEEADAATIERTGTLVGRAIASVANLLDLQLAVVGASVALGFGAPFFDAAQREIDVRAQLSFSRNTRIVPAALGANGPLVGAGVVAMRGL